MAKTLQAVRGMPDILPGQSATWQKIESVFREACAQYGYQELRTPILESTDVFKRSIGDATDIVEKEMYTFDDRNGDSLSLRPEGTASIVRAALQHGLLHNQIQRLWYTGPMFRHERPQKGRFRQFYQAGVEIFGIEGPAIEAELLAFCHTLWHRLGLSDVITLELNSLGSTTARAAYKEALVEFLTPHKSALDEDSQRRLSSNPLRILDSKVETTRAILADAPQLPDFFDQNSHEHLSQLREYLQALGINYRINPQLVRGLDYYQHTVFEWTTEHLGSQSTVCAGGRYDGLVEQLGGRANAAVGFAMGLDRLVLLCESQTQLTVPTVDCVVLPVERESVTLQSCLGLAKSLRESAKLSTQVFLEGGKIKTLFKKAQQTGAKYWVIVGDRDLPPGHVKLKMAGQEHTDTLSQQALLEKLQSFEH